MSNSRIINTVIETAKDLKLDVITMRELELINLKETKALSSAQIKRVRLKAKLSQSVMAKILNVTPSTYQKWERGDVHPKGANLKLLRLAYDHGVDYII